MLMKKKIMIKLNVYLLILFKSLKKKINSLVMLTKLLDCMLLCISLCLLMIFVRRNMEIAQDLPLNNLWTLVTRILLPCFSFKIGRERSLSSINSEDYMSAFMEILINSMMP